MRRIWQSFALVAAAAVAACSGATASAVPSISPSEAASSQSESASAAAPLDLTLGIQSVFTGQYADFGDRQKGGILFALSKRGTPSGTESAVVDNGAVNVKLVYADDEGDAEKGPIAAQQLLDARVNLMIGSGFSSSTAAALPLYVDAKVPVISPFTIRDDLVTIGEGWYFRGSAPNSCQAKVMGDIARGLNAKKVSMVDDNEAAGTDLTQQLAKLVEDGGATVSGQYHAALGQTDFSSIVNQLLQDNPDLVFYSSNYLEAGHLVQQARERGLKAMFVGSDGVGDPKIFAIADAAKLTDFGAVAFLPPAVAAKGGEWDAFVKAYAEFAPTAGIAQAAADQYVAYSYDALNMALDAAKKAASTDGEALRSAIQATDYSGVTGSFEFAAGGERVGCDVSYFVAQDGKWVAQPIPGA